jgi:hypothetical protein
LQTRLPHATKIRVPKGRTSLAQRGSAGKEGKRRASPEATTHVALILQQSDLFDLQHKKPQKTHLGRIADETLAIHGRHCQNHGFEAIKVGGVEDHAHSLLLLAPTIPLAKAVQILKACSSKWINDTKTAGRDFARQEGYGAFSVRASQTGRRDQIYRGPSGASRQAKLGGRVSRVSEKICVRYDPAHVRG